MKAFSRKSLIVPAVLAVAAVTGVSGAVWSADAPATAQAGKSAAEHRGHGHKMHHARFNPSRHIEGRIAFLRAELKITDAQSAQWDKVAAVMRDNAKAAEQRFEQKRAEREARRGAAERPARPDAVTRMNARVEAGEARLTALKNFAGAFQPLYQSLSDEQKKAADELVGQRRRHR